MYRCLRSIIVFVLFFMSSVFVVCSVDASAPATPAPPSANTDPVPLDIGLPNVIGVANAPIWVAKIINEFIKYVALLAVISVSIGWVMYLTSMGEEAKTKKAKNVLLYSIIGVVLSVSAYAIVDVIDRFTLK